MKPTKFKELIPQLAQELQCSEEEIASVLDVYWSAVRKTLSSLEHNRVFIPNLGTFFIKPWAIQKRLKANQNKLDNCMENPTGRSLTIMNDVFKENAKIQLVMDRENEEQERKQKIKRERFNKDLEGKG